MATHPWELPYIKISTQQLLNLIKLQPSEIKINDRTFQIQKYKLELKNEKSIVIQNVWIEGEILVKDWVMDTTQNTHNTFSFCLY